VQREKSTFKMWLKTFKSIDTQARLECEEEEKKKSLWSFLTFWGCSKLRKMKDCDFPATINDRLSSCDASGDFKTHDEDNDDDG
jgi:hypothetical protein